MPPERTWKLVPIKLQEKPSALKREHSALQNMKFFTFSIFVVIFALFDPDSDPKNCAPVQLAIETNLKILLVVVCVQAVQMLTGLERFVRLVVERESLIPRSSAPTALNTSADKSPKVRTSRSLRFRWYFNYLDPWIRTSD